MMTESVMVYNTPTSHCCGQPAGTCSCSPKKPDLPAEYSGNKVVLNSQPDLSYSRVENVTAKPSPLGLPQWEFEPVYNEQKPAPTIVTNNVTPSGIQKPSPLGVPSWDW